MVILQTDLGRARSERELRKRDLLLISLVSAISVCDVI